LGGGDFGDIASRFGAACGSASGALAVLILILSAATSYIKWNLRRSR
jgi:hypothetical protein